MLVCPKCGGTELYQRFGNAIAEPFVCKKCGYEGIVVEMTEEERENFLEELKSSSTNDGNRDDDDIFNRDI
jgi:predicted nucleic-acid-binding Zn-ribbon protein